MLWLISKVVPGSRLVDKASVCLNGHEVLPPKASLGFWLGQLWVDIQFLFWRGTTCVVTLQSLHAEKGNFPMKHGEFPMKHAKQCVFYMSKKVTMYHGKITKNGQVHSISLVFDAFCHGFPWFPWLFHCQELHRTRQDLILSRFEAAGLADALALKRTRLVQHLENFWGLLKRHQDGKWLGYMIEKTW